MTPVEFVKKAFRAFVGLADIKLNFSLPVIRYLGRESEFDYACGQERGTFYALNAFATCPRSYMLRYLLEKPLAIPFYEQVQEAVREVVADESMGRIRRDEMRSRFEKLYDEIVNGPFPIHQPKVDWPLSWKREVGDYIADYSPEWERRGWMVKDAYLSVSANIDGCHIAGVIDLLLENGTGGYAIVVHDSGSDLYRKKTGKIDERIETKRHIHDLKRKAYLYGEALAQMDRAYDGCLCEIILNFYKPKKGYEPFEMVCAWNEEERVEALHWTAWAGKLIDRATQERDWPAAELLCGKEDVPKADENFCNERCPSCLRCRWAAYHPEELQPFTDVTKVTVVPQKYIGVKISLREGLDRTQKIMSYRKTVTLADGRTGCVTKLKAVFQKMGVDVIGDLEGKRISDFFETVGCGSAKLEFILRLFYDIIQ